MVVELMDRIVLASNSQTKIGEFELLSRNPYVRRVQKHFEIRYPEGHPAHLKFERRTAEHAEWYERHGPRVMRIRDMVGGFLAVFCEKPHVAHSARAGVLLSCVPDDVFNPWHDPELYYIVGLLIWRTREWLCTQPGGYRRYAGAPSPGARRASSCRAAGGVGAG